MCEQEMFLVQFLIAGEERPDTRKTNRLGTKRGKETQKQQGGKTPTTKFPDSNLGIKSPTDLTP